MVYKRTMTHNLPEKEVAQAIWDTYLGGYSKALMTPVEQFDTSINSDSRKIVADVLREVVAQLGYTHLYVDGDHGLGVVNIRDIIKVCDELEVL
jgi:hypothetical protein